jgi:hypothetical protein
MARQTVDRLVETMAQKMAVLKAEKKVELSVQHWAAKSAAK